MSSMYYTAKLVVLRRMLSKRLSTTDLNQCNHSICFHQVLCHHAHLCEPRPTLLHCNILCKASHWLGCPCHSFFLSFYLNSFPHSLFKLDIPTLQSSLASSYHLTNLSVIFCAIFLRSLLLRIVVTLWLLPFFDV